MINVILYLVIFQNAKLWLRDIFFLNCSSRVYFKSFELHFWSWSRYRLSLPMAVYRIKKYWTENFWRLLEILWLRDDIEMRFSCIMCSQADSMSGYRVMTFFFGYVALETIVCHMRRDCHVKIFWFAIPAFSNLAKLWLRDVNAWPYS